MKISMIGTGYVGLVSGVCFSDFGHNVVCVDKATEKIARLTQGEVSIQTEWNEFRALDLTRLAKNMNRKRMADLRNIHSAKDARGAGFEAYVGAGR